MPNDTFQKYHLDKLCGKKHTKLNNILQNNVSMMCYKVSEAKNKKNNNIGGQGKITAYTILHCRV